MYLTSKLRAVCVSLGLLGTLGVAIALQAEEKSRSDQRPDDSESRTAQLILANELMRIHWTSWATDDEHAELVKDMIQGIHDPFKDQWKLEWLVPEVAATKRRQGAFEKSAVEAIRAGEPELRRAVSEGVNFILPVRARTTCLNCHTALRFRAVPLQEGDLLGIASVQLKR